MTPVSIYRWELPSGIGPLNEAVRRLPERECDVVLFTSSIQLDHLLEVSRSAGRQVEVIQALTPQVAAASVGPMITAALESHGLRADIVPQHPKMGALIRAASESAAAPLAKIRSMADSPHRSRPTL